MLSGFHRSEFRNEPATGYVGRIEIQPGALNALEMTRQSAFSMRNTLSADALIPYNRRCEKTTSQDLTCVTDIKHATQAALQSPFYPELIQMTSSSTKTP